jgi:hypothetical protein
MTVTTIRTDEPTRQDADVRLLATAAKELLAAMALADLDATRWESAGPLVSAAAQRLRDALGLPQDGVCGSVPPVVREADFGVAVRPLLGTPTVADTGAVQDFLGLAVDAALALGGPSADTHDRRSHGDRYPAAG